jgi:hypothetical protein
LRDAHARDSAMKREIKAEKYSPPASRVRDTVERLRSVLRRDAGPIPTRNDERRLFKLHILTRDWCKRCTSTIGRRAHTKQLVTEMRAETKADGSRRLSDKSIGNAITR